MANPREWGRWLKIFRDRTGQSQDDLVSSINGFYDALSDSERTALIALNLESYLTANKTGLSEAENGRRPPQTRDRVVLMIYYFSRTAPIPPHEKTIWPGEADLWLNMMDWRELHDEEPRFVFGAEARQAVPTRTYQEYQIDIPTGEEPGAGAPVVAIPSGASDLVVRLSEKPVETGGRLRLSVGFIIPVLSLLLLLLAAWLLVHPAMVKRLKDWLVPPVATPQQEGQTPIPPLPSSPAATQAMTDTLTPPASAEEYQKRGLAHVQQKQLDAAIADFTEAIRLKPDDADAYFSRGITFSGQGKIDQAMADFTEVIRLRPTDHLAYYQRGLLYRLRQEPERALDNFNQAIALQPEFALAFRDRGRLYQSLNRLPDALMDLRHYLTLRPGAEDRGAVQQRIAEMEAMLKKEK